MLVAVRILLSPVAVFLLFIIIREKTEFEYRIQLVPKPLCKCYFLVHTYINFFSISISKRFTDSIIVIGNFWE